MKTNQESILPHFFSLYNVHISEKYGIKLGHFIAIALFSYLESEKAYQQKSVNIEKFGRIDSSLSKKAFLHTTMSVKNKFDHCTI